MPPTTTTTDGKLGSSTDGKFLSAIEAFKKRTPSWMMQRDTLPPTTDIKKSRTDGKGDRKPSWMQPETMPTTTTTTTTTDGRRSVPGHGAERIGRKPKEIKQESLLKQRHVVSLLFMEAVYSVGVFLAARLFTGCRSYYMCVKIELKCEEHEGYPWLGYDWCIAFTRRIYHDLDNLLRVTIVNRTTYC